jgi:hypothetical protein
MANGWSRRAWVLFRGSLCWVGAVVCVGAGFVVPFMLVGRLVFAATYPPHNDLSDIGTGLIALGIAAIAALIAGVLGSWITALPALVLIDKSGVFNRLRRRRVNRDRDAAEVTTRTSLGS